uniref:Mitochondrial carrier protein n=1 Tax=Pseudo-nitzschia australis TaxID=44445 RepID=A0A7S4EF66_9STRA|mmetsp:Transcript_19317/g.42013  ORF Transcript_19317/g.42013 Transcript_19317/m.42013 type:complete len:281 (-) Transcript_19317:199-1041(-)
MVMIFLLQTALAEAAGGAAAGLVADSVLYAVDSAKVRAQSKPVGGTAGGGLRILFRGFVPSILLGSVPVFGSFFFLYAPVREMLYHSQYQILIPIASTCAAIPATIIGVPSDVIKKRLVLGIDANLHSTIKHVIVENGLRGFFAGWHVNLIRDLPFAALKIGLYESLASYYKSWYGLSKRDPIFPQGTIMCGSVSGIGCAVLTCPLDVVNTKIKTSGMASTSVLEVGRHIILNDGVSGLFRGVAMRSIVLGLGSCIFWPIQQSVSRYWQPIHFNHDGFFP